MVKYFDNLNLINHQQSQPKIESQLKLYKSSNKKKKRRSKTIKAKLAKIKSADFSKRLALGIKNQQVVIEPKISRLLNLTSKPEDEYIVNSLKYLLNYFSEEDFENFKSYPQWHREILMSSNKIILKNIESKQKKLFWAVHQIEAEQKDFKCVEIIVDYLNQLLELIIQIYKEHWNCDLSKGSHPKNLF